MECLLNFLSCIVAKFPVPIQLIFVAVYLTRMQEVIKGCPETSGRNYHYMLIGSSPEEAILKNLNCSNLSTVIYILLFSVLHYISYERERQNRQGQYVFSSVMNFSIRFVSLRNAETSVSRNRKQ